MGRRYEHAPIVQAILEFHVTTPEDLVLEDLAALHFGHEYADPQALYHLQGQLAFNEGGDLMSNARGDQIGFGFARDDGARVVQVGQHRFTFIWNGAYTDWTDFSSEAERAWFTYREAAKVTDINGIGVRFVNHIPLPNKPIEIKDYLRTSVDIPAHLPQVIRSLFFQVEIPMPSMGANATITSAILPEVGDAGALLLDIDVKAPTMLSTEDEAFDLGVRTTLDRLRLAKNFVFEACITDATRGIIS